MTIDLSQYVGKNIIVQLAGNYVLQGVVTDSYRNNYPDYPYKIDGWAFNEQGRGLSKGPIVKILTPFEGNGIAQKAPNINLDDFVGQTVMIKTRMDEYFVGELDEGLYLGNLCSYSKTGYSLRNGNLDIMEIYGKGAYEINTKTTFDNPNDNQIEQAKQVLNQMSEEQIAKLLKSLKSNP
jgi:small nuclear ribonucleoprotein (snRNP)-like protein